MNKGLVHIYCGDGKGKTTAAVGLAMRCAGAGGKVLFFQFLKNGKSSEILSLSNVENITIGKPYPDMKFIWNMTEAEKTAVCEFYQSEFEKIKNNAGKYNMIVLDEVIPSLEYGFITEEKLTEFIKTKPHNAELVLTGRNPSERLIKIADYVTCMKKVKHPYDGGVAARQGIEW